MNKCNSLLGWELVLGEIDEEYIGYIITEPNTLNEKIESILLSPIIKYGIIRL